MTFPDFGPVIKANKRMARLGAHNKHPRLGWRRHSPLHRVAAASNAATDKKHLLLTDSSNFKYPISQNQTFLKMTVPEHVACLASRLLGFALNMRCVHGITDSCVLIESLGGTAGKHAIMNVIKSRPMRKELLAETMEEFEQLALMMNEDLDGKLEAVRLAKLFAERWNTGIDIGFIVSPGENDPTMKMLGNDMVMATEVMGKPARHYGSVVMGCNDYDVLTSAVCGTKFAKILGTKAPDDIMDVFKTLNAVGIKQYWWELIHSVRRNDCFDGTSLPPAASRHTPLMDASVPRCIEAVKISEAELKVDGLSTDELTDNAGLDLLLDKLAELHPSIAQYLSDYPTLRSVLYKTLEGLNGLHTFNPLTGEVRLMSGATVPESDVRDGGLRRMASATFAAVPEDAEDRQALTRGELGFVATKEGIKWARWRWR